MDFKDKVKDVSRKVSDVAEKTYKTVASKSTQIIEETKLKIKLNDTEEEIAKLFEEIGLNIYEQYKSGKKIDTGIVKTCKRIDKLYKDIDKMDTKVLYLKNLRVCENCNEAIGVDNKFCPVCGYKQKKIKIKEEIKNENITTKICSQCETVHGEDVNYCTKCGQKF